MPTPDPAVFVVDDDPAVRDSLCSLVSSVGLPVKAFPTADAFLEWTTPEQLGCVVTDVRMPGMSGMHLQEALAARASALSVIIVTGHADVPMAIRAMKTGAVDFIEKPFNDQQLIELISKAVTKSVLIVRKSEETKEIWRRRRSLTARENEVFEQLIACHPNKVIAANLGLSQKTIEIHRAKLMRKMRAKSFAELITMATKLQPDNEIS